MACVLTFHQPNQVTWPRPEARGKGSIFRPQWKTLQIARQRMWMYHPAIGRKRNENNNFVFTNEDRIPKNLDDLLMITQLISRGSGIRVFVLGC